MAGEMLELAVLGERRRRQVEQPRGDDAAAPPHLGDVGEVEVEALVGRQLVRAAVLHDVEALGEGLHHAVLDAVVDHLHEVPGAARARRGCSRARRADRASRDRPCARSCRGPAPAPRRSDRAGRPLPCRRRSSGSSRAPGPTRRPTCRRRDSGCPWACSSLARRTSSLKMVLPPSMIVSPAVIMPAELADRVLGDLAGRQHHPDGARPFRPAL